MLSLAHRQHRGRDADRLAPQGGDAAVVVVPPVGARRFRRIGSAVLHEFRHVLPPTVYFFVGFNLIVLTKALILSQYNIEFSGYMLATVSALVVGKAVLVADCGGQDGATAPL